MWSSALDWDTGSMLGKKDKCPIQYLLKKTSTELEKALFCFIHFCKRCDTQFEWPLMRQGKRVWQPGHFLPFILVKSGVWREGGGGVVLHKKKKKKKSWRGCSWSIASLPIRQWRCSWVGPFKSTCDFLGIFNIKPEIWRDFHVKKGLLKWLNLVV